MDFDWGSAIGAAVSLYGSSQSANAAKGAGKDATNAANQANALQRYIYDDQRNLNMPALQAGNAARDRYSQLLGLSTGGTGTGAGTQPAAADPNRTNGYYYLQANPELQGTKWAKDEASLFQHFYKYGARNGAVWGPGQQQATQQTGGNSPALTQQQAFDAFRNTPGYQFRLDEGRKQLDASAAARGSLNSGATLKALTQYGQGVADQGYTGYMNSLSGLFGGAQQAVSNIGSAGQGYAGQVGNNLMGASQARQQSTYAANQARQNGYNSAAGFLGNWAGNSGWGG